MTTYELVCAKGHTITYTLTFTGNTAHLSCETPGPSCKACQELHREAMGELTRKGARAGIAIQRKKRKP